MPTMVATQDAELDRALSDFVGAVLAAGGANVLGIALYGSAAKGRWTPGISDVNVLIVVRDTSLDALLALAPAITSGRRRWRIQTFLVTPGDLEAAARLFPVKIEDIQHAHRALHGDVRLAGSEPDPAALRLRMRQEVKNLELRLRQRIVERGAEPDVIWGGVMRAHAKLAIAFEAVLRHRGQNPPPGRPAIFTAAAGALGIPAERVAPIAGLRRRDRRPDEASVRRISSDFLALLALVEERLAAGP